MGRIYLEPPRGWLDWLWLRMLYLRAFPPRERKPFHKIREMYQLGRGDVWCIRQEGRLVGFANTINGEGITLLDYLAVKKNCRGQGVGTGAMVALQEAYADRGLFVEIESTREACDNPEERNRRKQFYLKAGMEDFGVEAQVFTVRMELLGSRCRLDFEEYREFYRKYYSQRAAEHLEPVQ